MRSSRTWLRENLFLVRLTGKGNWYRFHHVFSDVLKARLALEFSETDCKNCTAGRRTGASPQAIFRKQRTHAVSAHDWERAARLLLAICAELYELERVGALRLWLENLPLEVLEAEPELAFWLAWAFLRTGKPKEAQRATVIAENAWHKSGYPGADRKLIRLGVLRTLLEWDYVAGIPLAETLLQLTPEDELGERARATIILALFQDTAGELERAEHQLGARSRFGRETGQPRSSCLELNAFAGILHERGKLIEAAEAYRTVIANGDEWNDLPGPECPSPAGGDLSRMEPAGPGTRPHRHRIRAGQQDGRTSSSCRLRKNAGGPGLGARRLRLALEQIDRSIARCTKVGFTVT